MSVTPAPLEALIGPRLGIVRRFEARALPPLMPQALRLVEAEIADTGRLAHPAGNPVAAGCQWWDEEHARAAALGEAMERYCEALLPGTLRRASFRQLTRQGVVAVAPEELRFYSRAQYAEPGFPFTPFTDDLAVLWVPALELGTGAPVMLPASFVFSDYFTGPTAREPVTNFPSNAGCATAPTLEASRRTALEEVIERHAVQTAWLSGAPLTPIELPAWMRDLFAGPSGRLESTAYLFPHDLTMPVAGLVLRDREAGIVTLGTACRARAEDAVMKAYAEAALLHRAAAELDDPDSPLMQLVARREGSPLKPWQADRRYARLYRDDWRDATDVLCHLQLYLDPEMQDRLAARLAGGAGVALEQIPDGDCSFEGLNQGLSRLGRRAFAVDLTAADIRFTGLHVSKVVVPGFRATAPAAFPQLIGLEAGASLLPLPHA